MFSCNAHCNQRWKYPSWLDYKLFSSNFDIVCTNNLIIIWVMNCFTTQNSWSVHYRFSMHICIQRNVEWTAPVAYVTKCRLMVCACRVVYDRALGDARYGSDRKHLQKLLEYWESIDYTLDVMLWQATEILEFHHSDASSKIILHTHLECAQWLISNNECVTCCFLQHILDKTWANTESCWRSCMGK